MTTEFHHKKATLFEEFKKRELHFLKTEMNLNSNIHCKKNMSIPLQEYLQKINQREQRSEKIYKDLMRKMEEFGKRTDQMTMKLEKLNALRNVALNSNNTPWPITDAIYDKPFHSYYHNTLLQTSPKVLSSSAPISDFPARIHPDISFANHSFDNSSSKPSSHSVTTQTEYVFCGNCNFPFILNSASNLNLSQQISNKTVVKEREQYLPNKLVVTQENLDFSEKTMISKSIVGHNLVPKSDYAFSDTHVYEHGNSTFLIDTESLKTAEISLKEQELANEPIKRRMSENYANKGVTDDYVTHTEEKQCVEVQDNDLLSNDGNFEQTVSKSDDGSMSREFNFLDSDKSHIPKRPSIHRQMSDDSNSQLTDGLLSLSERLENTQLEASYATPSNISHSEKFQQVSGSSEKVEETKSKELFNSAAPPSPSAHSENISAPSESDSFSEKETPLTATAAYQALLGNVNIARPKQNTPISESDSEDEIENVLANAVRRTSRITFDTAILDSKADKRKESIPEVKTEKNSKSLDSVSVNKPQNKLSKNTRKVLGLDTSSGSEMELEVKSPTSKIEEESDEFDFYD